METEKKRIYVAPTLEVHLIALEESIAAGSLGTVIDTNNIQVEQTQDGDIQDYDQGPQSIF